MIIDGFVASERKENIKNVLDVIRRSSLGGSVIIYETKLLSLAVRPHQKAEIVRGNFLKLFIDD